MTLHGVCAKRRRPRAMIQTRDGARVSSAATTNFTPSQAWRDSNLKSVETDAKLVKVVQRCAEPEQSWFELRRTRSDFVWRCRPG